MASYLSFRHNACGYICGMELTLSLALGPIPMYQFQISIPYSQFTFQDDLPVVSFVRLPGELTFLACSSP